MAKDYVLDISELGNMNGFEAFKLPVQPESSEELQEPEQKDDNIETVEGVIDDENQEGVDDIKPSGGEGNSPDFYNSIATSLLSDGILLLPEEDIKNIKTAEELSSAFKKHIELQLSEENRRVLEALDLGIPKEEFSQVEKIITWLSNIDEDELSDETDDANILRQNIIYQDLINSGVTPDKAKQLVKHSLDQGTDIEDALKAYEANKSYYLAKRGELIEERKKQIEEKKQAEKQRQENIKKLFLEKEEPVKGIKLSKIQRDNLYEQATKIVGKNKDGKFITALEKYAENNPENYQYNLNVLFYLTDGFKDLEKVISKEVTEQTKSKLRDLEKALKTPSGHSSLDNLRFGNDTSPDATHDGFSIDL